MKILGCMLLGLPIVLMTAGMVKQLGWIGMALVYITTALVLGCVVGGILLLTM